MNKNQKEEDKISRFFDLRMTEWMFDLNLTLCDFALIFPLSKKKSELKFQMSQGSLADSGAKREGKEL